MNSIPNKLFKTKLFTVCFNQGCNILERYTPQTIVPSRNTFILQRRYPVRLRKKGFEDSQPRYKGKDFVYDLVNTENKIQETIPVILKQYVEGIGQQGDCVFLKKNQAYNKLLITGLADYATPEAVDIAKKNQETRPTKLFSSLTAPQVVKYLEMHLLAVVMNKDVEWILEPWHIRVSFRKAGIHVPSSCIKLPNKPIKGPNLDWESKYFCVTVTINNKEKATVRCRLHHWSTNPGERLPYVLNPWALPQESIFPEDEQKLRELPLPKFKTINN